MDKKKLREFIKRLSITIVLEAHYTNHVELCIKRNYHSPWTRTQFAMGLTRYMDIAQTEVNGKPIPNTTDWLVCP